MSILSRSPVSTSHLKTVLNLIYPPQCMACDTLVETSDGFCGPCWRDVSFIHGLTCTKCGVPLPGDEGGSDWQCDDCLRIARPWRRGYASMIYSGTGRRIVLSLKHGDRTEIAGPAARWIAAKLPVLDPDTLIVPVPLHRRRFLKRRYNQSALLATALLARIGRDVLPDLLIRMTNTDPLDGKSVDVRFQTLTGAIALNPRRSIDRRPVLLVDDVMTSGATLAECTEICVQAGAREVDIAVLARVAKDV